MVECMIEVLMNEMTAIRNEINTTKQTIHSILNFFFVLIGAEISLFVALWGKTIDVNNLFIRILILGIPWIFMCLSLYHSECVMRIHTYSTYIDSNIRDKIKDLLGEPLLNSKSKYSTKSIIGLFKKNPLDAKLSYISKLGIKAIPMLLSCVFYLFMVQEGNINMSVLEYVMLSIDALLILSLLFIQHD